MFTEQDLKFAAEFLEKVEKKLTYTAPKIGSNFPWTDTDHRICYPDGAGANVSGWTVSFWPGMMWLMYIKTGNEMFREIAEGCEDKMDEAFDRFNQLHHDLGFMWELTSVANYKLTKNPRSRDRALHAATLLAGRFNHKAKFIRAWNFSRPDSGIIDSMMNIPILEWAARYSKEVDTRFSDIARAHADTVMKYYVRPDGSSNHIVALDTETGEFVNNPGGQGYGSGSSWSRGQAWAVYGFVAEYLNSGKQEYLDTAKRAAHYFIANMEPGKLPLLDFRAPREPVYYDSSAAAIAACGLIEISRAVDDLESDMYSRAAMNLLRVLDENCNYAEDNLILLENGSHAYHTNGIHLPYIFGDYYLVEALMKLYGNDGRFIIHNEPTGK
ncbi:MAG: glycoside hydrolase family 88 protein [Oscillospiraceae bacterium]|nr:glycoside hydrolase family 88 protein [Oscillospiraceae bacterium]